MYNGSLGTTGARIALFNQMLKLASYGFIEHAHTCTCIAFVEREGIYKGALVVKLMSSLVVTVPLAV